MQRRTLLKLLGLSGGGLLLGVNSAGCLSINAKKMRTSFELDGSFQPNAFLTIHPDGRIILAINKSEMGQGIMTASATLVAEELEVPISKIEPYQAYKLEFGNQSTGGSTSTKEIYNPIRKAAATAREMLRAAAAEEWDVDIEECSAKNGAIHHRSGKSLSYQSLTEQASLQSRCHMTLR